MLYFEIKHADPEYKPYHSNGFLLECLQDLNESLEKVGTKMHACMGCPLEIFRYLHKHHAVRRLCFIQDSEPIWHERDTSVKSGLFNNLSSKFINKINLLVTLKIYV